MTKREEADIPVRIRSTDTEFADGANYCRVYRRDSAVGNPFGFAGGWLVSGNYSISNAWRSVKQLWYFWNRHYEPEYLLRWLQPDLIGPWGDRNQRGGSMQYGGQSPLARRDAQGLLSTRITYHGAHPPGWGLSHTLTRGPGDPPVTTHAIYQKLEIIITVQCCCEKPADVKRKRFGWVYFEVFPGEKVEDSQQHYSTAGFWKLPKIRDVCGGSGIAYIAETRFIEVGFVEMTPPNGMLFWSLGSEVKKRFGDDTEEYDVADLEDNIKYQDGEPPAAEKLSGTLSYRLDFQMHFNCEDQSIRSIDQYASSNDLPGMELKVEQDGAHPENEGN